MTPGRLIRAGMTLLLLTLVGGCTGQYGDPCDMHKKIEENCRLHAEEGVRANCVMTENLDCESRLCAIWQDSDPYCTLTCSGDGGCPEGACQVFFEVTGEQFCVPPSKL